MTQKQAIVIFILTLFACSLLFYYGIRYFPFLLTAPQIPTARKQENPSPQARIPVSYTGRIQKQLRKYRKEKNISDLKRAILYPQRYFPQASPKEISRLRSLAMVTLLLTPGQKAAKAYLELLSPKKDKDLLLPALSALLSSKAKDSPLFKHYEQEVEKKLKNLAFHTKSPLIRTKASQIYQKLYSRK